MAIQYLILFFTSAISQVFVAAKNVFGRYNNSRLKFTNQTEFKTSLGLILHFGIIKYPHSQMTLMKDKKYCLPWIISVMKEYRFDRLLQAWHNTDASRLSTKEERVGKIKN